MTLRGITDLVRGGTQSNWRVALCAVLWIAVAARYAHMLPKLPSRATEYDFLLYYTAAQAVESGLDPYRIDLPAMGARLGGYIAPNIRCNYTPPFVAAIAPLAKLPIRKAFWLWVGISTAAFGAALGLLFEASELDTTTALATTAAILMFPPTWSHLKYSQSQFIILLLLVLVWRLTRRGWDAAGGVALAAAALFKAYPIVLGGYLLSKRKWRALAWAAAGTAAGIALTSAKLPLHTWVEFASNNGSDPFFETQDNLALTAFVTRAYMHLFTAQSSYLIRHGTIAAIQLAVIAAAFRSTTHSEDTDGTEFSVWVVAMLLLSPIVWLHYLPLLAIPIVQMVSASAKGYASRATVAAGAAAFGLISVSWLLAEMEPRHGAAELLSEFGTLGMIAAYAAVLGLARDERVAKRRAERQAAV